MKTLKGEKQWATEKSTVVGHRTIRDYCESSVRGVGVLDLMVDDVKCELVSAACVSVMFLVNSST